MFTSSTSNGVGVPLPPPTIMSYPVFIASPAMYTNFTTPPVLPRAALSALLSPGMAFEPKIYAFIIGCSVNIFDNGQRRMPP